MGNASCFCCCCFLDILNSILHVSNFDDDVIRCADSLLEVSSSARLCYTNLKYCSHKLFKQQFTVSFLYLIICNAIGVFSGGDWNKHLARQLTNMLRYMQLFCSEITKCIMSEYIMNPSSKTHFVLSWITTVSPGRLLLFFYINR